MISIDQRKFALFFVCDGEYDLQTTCQSVGIRPSVAMSWFRDIHFRQELRRAEAAQLQALGCTQLRLLRETWALATSNIADVQPVEGDLKSLPLQVQRAIKQAKFKPVQNKDGSFTMQMFECTMHPKDAQLAALREMYAVGTAPEILEAAAITVDEGVKRIAGLMIRPPLTDEEKDIEDLLS